MIGRHVLSDASIAPADEYIQRMLLRAYGRSVLVYTFHSRETSIVGAARC